MKVLAVLLAIIGTGMLGIILVNHVFSTNILGIAASALSSDGGYDAPVGFSFRGMDLGLIFTALLLSSFSILLFLIAADKIDIMKHSEMRFVLIVLGIKILICLLVVLFSPYKLAGVDDQCYDHYARCFATGSPILESDGKPTAWWPIGYPLLLSLLYRLFGPVIIAGQILNILILTGITFLIYLLGKQLFSASIARKGMLITALVPSMTIYSIPLLSDGLFSLLVLLTIYWGQSKVSALNAILAGLAFGAATLTRSVALLLPFVLFAFQMLRYRKWKPVLVQLLVVFLVGEIVLLPWQIRNFRVFGAFTLVSTNGGIHFWMGNNPNASGGFINGGLYVPDETNKWMESITEVEKDHYAFKQGLSFMLHHPLQTVRKWPQKMIFFFSKDSRSVIFSFAGVFEQIWPPLLLMLILTTEGFYTALLITFFASLVILYRREKTSPRFWLLAGITLYFSAIYTLFVAEGRYHLPLIPFFALVVAAASYQSAKNST